MARDNSSLYVLSIVAVVAVVGLVTLFLDGSVAAPSVGAGDFVGQAIGADADVEDSRQRVLVGAGPEGKTPFTSREDSRERQLAEQKRISDAIAKKY